MRSASGTMDANTMVCAVCQSSISSMDFANDNMGKEAPHHPSLESLRRSMEAGCHICTTFWALHSSKLRKPSDEADIEWDCQFDTTSLLFHGDWPYGGFLAERIGVCPNFKGRNSSWEDEAVLFLSKKNRKMSSRRRRLNLASRLGTLSDNSTSGIPVQRALPPYRF